MKNFVLGVSFVMVLLLLYLRTDFERQYCHDYTDSIICFENAGFIQGVILFFPVLLFFSLLTYKLPERIFKAWWVFAKYAIPVVIAISIYINLGLHHSPVGMWQDILDIPMLIGL